MEGKGESGACWVGPRMQLFRRALPAAGQQFVLPGSSHQITPVHSRAISTHGRLQVDVSTGVVCSFVKEAGTQSRFEGRTLQQGAARCSRPTITMCSWQV